MNSVIIVFVIATGYVAVDVVLPIIFWFTQTSTSTHAALHTPESQTTLESKPLPTSSASQLSCPIQPGPE